MLISFNEASACTAAVISGKATPDGRPLLWKHRDTGILDNRLEFFRGSRYCFTGLVNSGGASAPGLKEGEREVWIGSNTAGFSIMNTASYNIKYDDVPSSCMDREGILIWKALGVCGDIYDFEHFLDTLSRPLGVQANFGVVDARGGAAMYEVNNTSYVKYDVNDPDTAPGGYLVFTNFSFSGCMEDALGYERYITASNIFGEARRRGDKFTPEFIMDSLSRSYRNDLMGVNYNEYLGRMISSGLSSGIVPDSDFIPRGSTSASVVIKGVKNGEDPSGTVLWTLLGYPACGAAVPVPVFDEDHIPSYMGASGDNGFSRMCDVASDLKERYVFRFSISNGKEYLDLVPVLEGRDSMPSLLSCSRNAEKVIREDFESLHEDFVSGRISSEEYIGRYDVMADGFFDIYIEEFKYLIAHLLKNH